MRGIWLGIICCLSVAAYIPVIIVIIEPDIWGNFAVRFQANLLDASWDPLHLLDINQPSDSCPGIYLLQPLVMMGHNCSQVNTLGYKNPQNIPTRIAEYRECINFNLMHANVCAVYLLSTCSPAESVEYVTNLGLNNTRKLTILPLDVQTVRYKDAFSFISTHLLNRTAMFINADTFLGDGFQLIDPGYMRENRVFYALTRTWFRCKVAGARVHCGTPYVKSHDGWLFVPTEPFSQDNLDFIDFTTNDNGAESALMWVLKFRLNFNLLNPCKQVKLLHNHCSGVRPNGRRRIDKGQSKKWGRFTHGVPYSDIFLPKDKTIAKKPGKTSG